jgi:hypothetical protein
MTNEKEIEPFFKVLSWELNTVGKQKSVSSTDFDKWTIGSIAYVSNILWHDS